MTPDATACYQSMRLSASLRIVDLMDRTGFSRRRVHVALDELKRAGIVQSFSMGSRYSIRQHPICPPAATPAHGSTLADDTHATDQVLRATALCTVDHTAETWSTVNTCKQ